MSTAARQLGPEGQATLQELLLSGGDRRLALELTSGLNVYGCAPVPRSDIDDFSSSTASTISEYAYRRAEESWRQLSLQGARFDDFIEEARTELKSYLGLHDREAEIVFLPSGTDAQLIAFFLVRAVLGTPLVSIIVGADQTGSGTAYVANGLHFADHGAFKRGDEVRGLTEGGHSIAIPFCDGEGNSRISADLDSEIMTTVEAAIAGGACVLLHAMASSKLGWASPSSACAEALVKRWPDKLRIVMDACQMRVSNARIRDYLGRGNIVLATGSKFFCGPPFSGALLVPSALRDTIATIGDAPVGLKTYSRKFDWPSCWPRLRAAFPPVPNIGQWLRWEAALEEMRAYYAVPSAFRAMILRRFAQVVPDLLAGSPWLAPLYRGVHDPDSERDDEFAVPTIFSFRLKHPEGQFSQDQCATMHRLLNRDISLRIPAGDDVGARRLGARHCHIGQPVAIGPADGAVLRISSSARLVVRCWSPDPAITATRLDAEIGKVNAVIGKLSLAVRHFAAMAT